MLMRMRNSKVKSTFLLFLYITGAELYVTNVYDLTNEFSNKETTYAPKLSNGTLLPGDQQGEQVVGGVDLSSVLSSMNNRERSYDSLVKDIQEKAEEQETNRKSEQNLIINNSKVGTIVSLDHARNEFEAIMGKSGIKLNETGHIQDTPSAGPISVMDDANTGGGSDPMGVVDDAWMTYENTVSLPVRLKPSGDVVPLTKPQTRKNTHACKNAKRKSRILFCL